MFVDYNRINLATRLSQDVAAIRRIDIGNCVCKISRINSQ